MPRLDLSPAALGPLFGHSSGGAWHLWQLFKHEIDDCIFTSCSSADYAGALYSTTPVRNQSCAACEFREWIVGHVDTSGIKPRLVIKHRSFTRCSHMKAGPLTLTACAAGKWPVAMPRHVCAIEGAIRSAPAAPSATTPVGSPRLVIKHRFIRCSHMKAGPVDSLRGRQVASGYAAMSAPLKERFGLRQPLRAPQHCLLS